MRGLAVPAGGPQPDGEEQSAVGGEVGLGETTVAGVGACMRCSCRYEIGGVLVEMHPGRHARHAELEISRRVQQIIDGLVRLVKARQSLRAAESPSPRSAVNPTARSAEHTSELQSLMRLYYA